MVAIPLACRTSRSRRRRYLKNRNQAPTSKVPRKNRRHRNDRGGICSSAAFVAGKVAPQIKVVRSSASRGMNVRKGQVLRFAEGTAPQVGWSGLLHRGQRAFFIRIV